MDIDTLLVYLAATFLTAFAWDLSSFLALRFLTGAGIGGEYAAINSAIDELIPARWRGQVDLGVNGSWWLAPYTEELDAYTRCATRSWRQPSRTCPNATTLLRR